MTVIIYAAIGLGMYALILAVTLYRMDSNANND